MIKLGQWGTMESIMKRICVCSSKERFLQGGLSQLDEGTHRYSFLHPMLRFSPLTGITICLRSSISFQLPSLRCGGSTSFQIKTNRNESGVGSGLIMGQLFLNFIYHTVKLRDKGAGLGPAQQMVGAQQACQPQHGPAGRTPMCAALR